MRDGSPSTRSQLGQDIRANCRKGSPCRRNGRFVLVDDFYEIGGERTYRIVQCGVREGDRGYAVLTYPEPGNELGHRTIVPVACGLPTTLAVSQGHSWLRFRRCYPAKPVRASPGGSRLVTAA